MVDKVLHKVHVLIELSQGFKLEFELDYHWNYQVKTDRHIPFNKSDVIIHDKGSGRCVIIEAPTTSSAVVVEKIPPNCAVICNFSRVGSVAIYHHKFQTRQT